MRAASLKETDYSLKTCIINAESTSLQVNQNIKNPWDMLLKSNDRAKTFNIKVPLNDDSSYNFNESKNTYLRFKGASIEKKIFKPFTEKICCKSAAEATIKNLKSNLMIELLNYFDAQKQMRIYLENNNAKLLLACVPLPHYISGNV